MFQWILHWSHGNSAPNQSLSSDQPSAEKLMDVIGEPSLFSLGKFVTPFVLKAILCLDVRHMKGIDFWDRQLDVCSFSI